MTRLLCLIAGRHTEALVATPLAHGGRGVALHWRCLHCGRARREIAWPWVRTVPRGIR